MQIRRQGNKRRPPKEDFSDSEDEDLDPLEQGPRKMPFRGREGDNKKRQAKQAKQDFSDASDSDQEREQEKNIRKRQPRTKRKKYPKNI